MAYQSTLEELLCVVHEELNDASVGFAFGRRRLMEHDQLRRVVWVRAPGRFEAPQQGGGRIPGDASKFRIPSCYRHSASVEAHCFAEDDYCTELLAYSVVAAVHRTLGPNAVAISDDWVNQADGEDGETLRSEKCVLRFTIRIPVPEEIKQTFPVTGAVENCGTIQPDDSILPEPQA